MCLFLNVGLILVVDIYVFGQMHHDLYPLRGILP